MRPDPARMYNTFPCQEKLHVLECILEVTHNVAMKIFAYIL
jgi:hypothetical protein